MVEADDRLQGIEAPGLDGRGLTAVRYSAFADDLMLYARSYTELSVIRELMDTFELASGAQRNRGKTVGLRAGSLHGVAPPVDTVPPELLVCFRAPRWAGCATEVTTGP